MTEREESNNISSLREHAWHYFRFHAEQRLKTFNFFIIMSTVIATGYLTIMKDSETSYFGAPLGILLSYISYIFWKLDVRIKQLAKNAEKAIKYTEKFISLADENGLPHPTKIFSYEVAATKRLKQKRSFLPWKRHYSYSESFIWLFRVFGIFGLIGALYSVSQIFIR